MLLRVPLSRRALSLVAVAFGGALLVWQIREIGTEEIARGFAAVGVWGAVAILLLSGLRFLARSTGWTALLTTDTPPGHALGAVIAGDAAGNLTPLSMLVSEPAKAAVLAWAVPGVSTRDELAALAAETFFFGVSVALYVLLGVGALLYAYDIDPSLRLAGLVTLSAMTIALVIASWMALKRPTVVGSTLARAPFGLVRTLAERVRAFERTAYGTTTHPGARLGVVAAAAVSFHALSFVELWLTLWLLTGESHIVAALVLDTVGRLTNALFKVIPMQIGVLQVGSELVARAIGLAPGIGLMVSLLRTARVIFWTGIGLLILGRHSTTRN
jgi:hypothetical protein